MCESLTILYNLLRPPRPSHTPNPHQCSQPLQPPPTSISRSCSRRVSDFLDWHLSSLRRHTQPSSNAHSLRPLPLTSRNSKEESPSHIDLQLPVRINREPVLDRSPSVFWLLRISNLSPCHYGRRRRVQNCRATSYH